ncbi:MAG: hypothetical protein R3Y54_06355 [Eubacteriales bacterium]
MKSSIVKEMISGGVFPVETKYVNTPKYQELQTKIREERDYFETEMSQMEKERFDDYHGMIQERMLEEMG